MTFQALIAFVAVSLSGVHLAQGAPASPDGILYARQDGVASPTDPVSPTPTGDIPPMFTLEIFDWAVIGDSWSAGVSYSKHSEYDNDFICKRTNESWGALMEKDNTWTYGVNNLTFKACSGAKTPAMKDQIKEAGTPRLVVLTMGGNNAFFGKTVTDCVYQPDSFKDYGKDYPDPSGECKKGIEKTKEYVNNKEKGLAHDFKLALDDIFASEQAKSHEDFWVMISGYAHFFNDKTDDCSNWSFARFTRHSPKLYKDMRVEFNQGLDKFHEVVVSI